MSLKQLMDLSGRVALITGGSRGLGLQMAEALGEMGAKLAITARKRAELDEARAHLEALGCEVLTVASDLAKFDTIPAVVDQVMQHYGQIDILVNNAGTTWGAPAEEHSLEGWQKVIDLNLTALFRLSQEVGNRSMLPRCYGRIINVASLAALIGNLPQVMKTVAYNASKGGVASFTRALAAEWGTRGITVNTVCPGWFHSKMASQVIEHSEKLLLDLTPLGRFGGDEDLKGIVALLASDAGRHITGQAIAVDGGLTIV
jgi:NAD(P)-dependent dehydrogenase (short-subunit alcohol dehydrogenase family)